MNSFTNLEVIKIITEELSKCIEIPVEQVPTVVLSTKPEAADYACNVSQYFATLKKQKKAENGLTPAKLSVELAEKIMKSEKRSIIIEATSVNAYLNLKVDHAKVFDLVCNRVFQMGDKYGSSQREKPMKVIVEHTSANPNSPLHIGNLRNVMIGAHLARLMKFCGIDVKEYFYVNDLGGQIGVTALGYTRMKHFPEGMKIDQLIGSVYAVMNTFNEAQKNGFKLSEFNAIVAQTKPKDETEEAPEDENTKEQKQAAKKPENKKTEKTQEEIEAELKAKREDLIYTGASLRTRFPEIYNELAAAFRDDESIQILGAALNKAYENRDPEAVKIIRKMTNDTLTGQKQTLDTYGVCHDRFDFESELSWEGTSSALLKLFQQSPFFHPQTQCNAQGKPEGAYLDLDAYLDSIKAKRGKGGGYAKPYPNFYVLRPDGTTLYTFRDIAYSMKKISEADMVLNVICTEQNLPQEKVMLTLKALGVQGRPQFHMAYELVKLSENGRIKRMSGRKGYYILADTLYDDLCAANRKVMESREKKQIQSQDEEQIKHVCHVVANAAMKYALLSVSNKVKINFDIAEAVDPTGNSAAFILYSGARIASILRKFDNGVASGVFTEPKTQEINWSLLDDPQEWEILTKYIMPFASLIESAAIPKIPPEPKLPEFGTHVIPQFAYQLARIFASYYGRVQILPKKDDNGNYIVNKEILDKLYARITFCRAVSRVLHNALNLFMVEPLDAM